MTTAIKRPDKPEVRSAIFQLEEMLLSLPQADMITTNHFAPGVYARELFIPRNVTLTGYIHKTEHFSILLSGTLIMTDGDGGSIEINAPQISVAMIGTKRVAFAKTDVRYLTIHASDETDIDTLEDMLFTNDFQSVEHIVDQQDYDLMVQETGLTLALLEELKKIPVNKGDIENLEIRPSPRHGLGLFVNGFIPAGAIIAPAVKDGKFMEYSRYTNHSMDPNARRDIIDSYNINIIAIRDIQDEEVTGDYREPFGVMK